MFERPAPPSHSHVVHACNDEFQARTGEPASRSFVAEARTRFWRIEMWEFRGDGHDDDPDRPASHVCIAEAGTDGLIEVTVTP